MFLKRNIISFILMLTYAVSFVHDIVPHVHHHNPVLKDLELSLINNKQQIAIQANVLSPQYIDYQKSGMLDYVICLFESVNHGVTGDNEFKAASKAQFQLSDVDIKLPIIPTPLFQSVDAEVSIEQEVSSSAVNKLDNFLLSVKLDCIVLRGPPVFSC